MRVMVDVAGFRLFGEEFYGKWAKVVVARRGFTTLGPLRSCI